MHQVYQSKCHLCRASNPSKSLPIHCLKHICTVIETLSFYCCFHSALLCTFMLFMLEIVYTLRISHDGVQCNLELEIAKLSMTKGASFQHVRLHTHTCVWTVHGSWTTDCRLPSWNCSSMEDITCYFVSKSPNLVEKTVENASNEEFISMKQQVTSQVNEICRKCRCLELTPAKLVNFKTVMPQATLWTFLEAVCSLLFCGECL